MEIRRHSRTEDTEVTEGFGERHSLTTVPGRSRHEDKERGKDRLHGGVRGVLAFLATLCRVCLAKACYEMSRRDGAIVAWHEVPGIAPP